MSDIQAIIKLIEEGHRNNDHGDGRRQINEAVAMLRKMQEDSHLHSGQRWELSQILGCGPLYGDIERTVRGLKEAQDWQPIETAPKDGKWALVCSDGAVNCAYVEAGKTPEDWTKPRCPNIVQEHVTHWMPIPEPPPYLAEPE